MHVIKEEVYAHYIRLLPFLLFNQKLVKIWTQALSLSGAFPLKIY